LPAAAVMAAAGGPRGIDQGGRFWPRLQGYFTAMSAAKTLAGVVGSVWAVPHRLMYGLDCAVMGRERALIGASERVGRMPGHWGVYTRQAFYRTRLEHVGSDVYFGFMSLLSKPGASIGDRVYIGRFCTLGLVTLEDEVMLADGVQVLSGRHHHGGGAGADGGAAGPEHGDEVAFSRVTIGRGAWVGANAVVMADVGSGAIVGAGAVVVKPVGPGQKVGGVPAKVL